MSAFSLSEEQFIKIKVPMPIRRLYFKNKVEAFNTDVIN
ncbi:hypothetical protein BN863_8590 [Formosa agariphila KMM 3901]|uniref:Uncharacterized protein n=1 Tax=Formosa agariphila (strain DSM 15362 / KCTC 12365 / LMG 23005 / KMM 3901 / M-2Alg 35-1) TaxID=1347342 RepID=T2KJH3_FORAG|nr:hypothetical protein BN863_8590 [Formosa agariphila KMM 3901]